VLAYGGNTEPAARACALCDAYVWYGMLAEDMARPTQRCRQPGIFQIATPGAAHTKHKEGNAAASVVCMHPHAPDASGQVDEVDGSLHLVNILPSRPRGARSFHLHVFAAVTRGQLHVRTVHVLRTSSRRDACKMHGRGMEQGCGHAPASPWDRAQP
jgi:hypothetical protein